MADSSKGSILQALGPIWIGASLISLIVGAFFTELWEAVMPGSIIPYLLAVWLLFSPGVVMLWFADRQL
jgi:hypothetical protein